MASNGMEPELSARQRRMVTAMLSSPTIKDAAQSAGINEATAWRYLQDPALKRALAERQTAVLGHASRRLAREMGAAMDVLCQIMRDEGASDGARVSAARAVLDSGLRLAELVTLAERVAAIEDRMEES
jgi:phage terminase small subunit